MVKPTRVTNSIRASAQEVVLSLEVRKDLLRLCAQTQIHIGGDLSVTDVMCAIWQHFIVYDPENPHWEGDK